MKFHSKVLLLFSLYVLFLLDGNDSNNGSNTGSGTKTSFVAVQALPQFDDETYSAIMDDPRAQVDTVYTSYAGITTARITGFTSSLSSCLILFLILRSANGLSTSYHRLVFGMSVADALGSIAIFCSTWPMPKDMIYSQFQSSVYGNENTCTAQGFVFFLGAIGTFAFNTNLSIYYRSVIWFKISKERFRKRVEPVLFFFAITVTLVITIPLLLHDYFVPTPWDFSCTGARYPYWCGAGTSVDGNDDPEKYGECIEPPNSLLWLRLTMLGIYFVSAMVIFCRNGL